MNFVEQVFGNNGALAAAFEGYKPRAGQVEMVKAITDAIAAKAHLVVEGPTGCGKSIAYLVPSIKSALEEGKSVVVCTANIALQEQIVSKDLPTLQDVLGRLGMSFTFQLMKGIGNYACKIEATDPEVQLELDPADEQVAYIRQWLEDTEHGDMSELPFQPSPAIWKKFSTTSEDCLGNDCRLKEVCFAKMAKERAQTCQVVVTNYHMLIAHLMVEHATEGHVRLLPEFDTLVCDEAHKFADIVRDFIGFEVKAGSVKAALDGVRSVVDPADCDKALFLSDNLFSDLKALYHSKEYKARLKRPPNIQSEDLCNRLRRLADQTVNLSKKIEDKDEKLKLIRKATRLTECARKISEAMFLKEPKHNIYYLEQDQRQNVALASKPIHVGAYLDEMLWSKISTGVVTSATIRVGDSFEFICNELGLDLGERCRTKAIASPFDYMKNMRLIVPAELVEPNHPEYQRQVVQLTQRAIELAGGRTLALFTSYRNLTAAANGVKVRYKVLVQGGGLQRRELIERFKAEKETCLFGTESFWAGVDVPGESLSCVVIDRLPFPSPDDPLMDALAEQYPNDWFFRFSLPRMTIQFVQGVGRLIRSVNDRGVVVVLDNRLATKGYRHKIISSLPKMKGVVTDINEVARFLNAA